MDDKPVQDDGTMLAAIRKRIIELAPAVKDTREALELAQAAETVVGAQSELANRN
jgi:hypothetical protein